MPTGGDVRHAGDRLPSPRGAYDPVGLAAACSFVLVAMGLVVLDVRIQRVDVLSDPVGFAVAVQSARRLRSSTPRTRSVTALLVLSPLAVVASVVTEVGGVVHGTTGGLAATAAVPADAPAWVAGAALTGALLSVVGVVLLSRHLRTVLAGIASDRWRQVTIAWVAFVALGTAGLSTGALELVLLAAATGLTAVVLLVLSLLATRRFVEEGGLDARPGPDQFV